MTWVKICGLSTVEDALTAQEAGADLLGVILAPSPRQVAPEQARALVQAVQARRPQPATEAGRRLRFPLRPSVVGVFVNLPPQEVKETASYCGFDAVQMSGQEPWEDLLELPLPVIKAVHIAPGQSRAEVTQQLRHGYHLLAERGGIALLDTKDPSRSGGTGRAWDWGLARSLAQDFPFLLAGGLTPDNVAQAVRQVRPWGVDVSSGVETAGKKDPAKIRAFLQAVRQTEPEETAPR